MSAATITFLVLGAVIVLFVSNRVPVELVAIGATLTLWATGVLDLDQALGGFADPAVLLIASLFVVSEALDTTGTTTWIGQQVLARAGGSPMRLLVMIMLLVAAVTAVINVNGSVASLLPMTVLVAVRTAVPPSRLLMPLAFAAHAGSLLALTGTPVNVVVSEAAEDAAGGGFGFFEFALAGVPVLALTMGVIVVLGRRVLPDRAPGTLTRDLSSQARVLRDEYLAGHRVFRLVLPPDSPLVGQPTREVADRQDDSWSLVGVQVGGRGDPVDPDLLRAGDVLVVRGDPSEVRRLAGLVGLVDAAAPFVLDGGPDLMGRDLGAVEVVVPPRSALIGQTMYPGMVTDSGDLVVLGIRRQGADRGTAPVRLAEGDALLVQGPWADLDRLIPGDPDVLAVDDPRSVRRQAVPLGPKSRETVAVLAGMVILLATGVVPAVVAGLLAASALVLLRVLTPQQAYRGVGWTTVVLVAAMIPLSTAMTESGAAEQVAGGLVDVVRDLGPTALLLGLFVLTAVLGQLISNMATALIVIPIAVSSAAELGISARPVLMSVAVAAAAALLTPVATPANLMVMQPAGYRFGDYARLGLPLLAVYLVVAVLWVPLVWRF